MRNSPLRQEIKRVLQKQYPGFKIGNIKWNKDKTGFNIVLDNRKHRVAIETMEQFGLSKFKIAIFRAQTQHENRRRENALTVNV